MEEILHQLTGSLSQRFARFYTSQVLQDFFQQYCSFGYPRWIYGGVLWKPSWARFTTVASFPRSSPIPWRTRHLGSNIGKVEFQEMEGLKTSKKNARASQKNSVINRFFTFYKSKQVFLVEFLCEFCFFFVSFFFGGGLWDIPPQKKTSPPNMTLPQTPMLGPWRGFGVRALDPTGLKFCGPKF